MSKLLAGLLAPYMPGGWLCLSVGEDDGGGEAEQPEGDAEEGEGQEDEKQEGEDEPGEDADEDAEDAEGDGEAQPPKQGRRQGRIERLNARLAQEKAARELAEAEAQRMRQPQAPARSDAETEAEIQRQEEAAGLKYEQRLYNAAQRQQQRSQQRQRDVENVLADKLDAIEYATECQGNEIARRHRDEVEKRLTTMRNGGRNAPRMGLLALIIGENVIKQSKNKQPSKRKEEAEQRITQRRGEPPGNRSDASNRGVRRDDAKAREKRLLNIRI